MGEAIVTITGGQVRGVREGGVTRFLDIPYAAPPIGERRFALPQPHEPWAGVRDGCRYGATAPQRHRPFPVIDASPLIGSDDRGGVDYLTVNVWAPQVVGQGAGQDLPVMVFIHGGAFVLGSNQAAVQDGTGFARSGVVLVSINYRLGIEGFLPIPGAPPNLGLHDQIAALKWVQDNADKFGGDPANVTVFGESAGAMSIADLLSSPLAKGLFRRAIVQSGHGAMVHSAPVAQRLVKRLARRLKVAPTPAGFAGVETDRILDAIDAVHSPKARLDMREPDTGIDPAFGLSKFLPVWGDEVLPRKPIDGLRMGAGAEVDLLIGTNAEEMNLYFVPTGVRRKLAGWLARFILSKVMPRAGEVLKAYGSGAKGRHAGDCFTEALHDLVFRWPARQFAAAHAGRTHVYELEWRSPAVGGQLGACHGLELGFVFDTLASVSGPKGLAGEAPPQELADRVHRLWVDFARNGALPWPEYTVTDRQVYRLAAGAASAEPVMKADAFLS